MVSGDGLGVYLAGEISNKIKKESIIGESRRGCTNIPSGDYPTIFETNPDLSFSKTTTNLKMWENLRRISFSDLTRI